MSEQTISRRLRVMNRLEELRAKYGHEDTWPEAADYREDMIETPDPRAGKEGESPSPSEAPLPSLPAGAPSSGVMPPASPGIVGTPAKGVLDMED